MPLATEPQLVSVAGELKLQQRKSAHRLRAAGSLLVMCCIQPAATCTAEAALDALGAYLASYA